MQCSPVLFDHLASDYKPKTGTFGAFRREESVEKLLLDLMGHTGSIIANSEYQTAFFEPSSYHNPSLFASVHLSAGFQSV